MNHHPPPEATSRQAFLEDLDCQVAAAHAAGAFTAVLDLARGEQDRLRREFADVTSGQSVRWVPNSEQTERSPVAVRIDRLRWELGVWDDVAAHAGEFAANEAHGWTIMPDGTCAKALSNGKVVSAYAGVGEWEDSDGRRYTNEGPGEQWKRRHRRHVRAFGVRVRGERLALARRTTPPAGQRHARHRGSRRPRRQTTRSSAASGDGPDEPEPPAAQLVLAEADLAGRLAGIAANLRARGGVG